MGDPFRWIADLLQGKYGQEFFSPSGDPRITQALREQVISDSASAARSRRLGLAGRSDIDPSTYGFQSLVGDLQGQSDLSQQLSAAGLQQMLSGQQFGRDLLGRLLQAQTSRYAADRGAPKGDGGFDWIGAASDIGSLLAALGLF